MHWGFSPSHSAHSISDLLSSDVTPMHPFILRERKRSEHCPVEHLRTVSEVADGDAFVVDVASGFEIVDVDTSVIDYSMDCDGEYIISFKNSIPYISN